ncbi:hypothetical protein CEXT_138791 [Caerostris extrusa]|uniref:Uncharacterized protein n=1 Tax=Caerostris extrusa TaxID=172846 RepID=A0AAV4R776_CAEEX|nr:hypothetical protein CEXT_138791 [Caerostris extrusa]
MPRNIRIVLPMLRFLSMREATDSTRSLVIDFGINTLFTEDKAQNLKHKNHCRKFFHIGLSTGSIGDSIFEAEANGDPYTFYELNYQRTKKEDFPTPGGH